MKAWREFFEAEELLRLRLTSKGEGDGKRARMGSKPPLDLLVLDLLRDFELVTTLLRAQYRQDGPIPWTFKGWVECVIPIEWATESVPGIERTVADLVWAADRILTPPSLDGNATPAYRNSYLNNNHHKALLVNRARAAKAVGVPPAVIDAWTKAGRIRNHAPGDRAPQYDLAQVVNYVTGLAGTTLRCGGCGRPMARVGKGRSGQQRWRCTRKKCSSTR